MKNILVALCVLLAGCAGLSGPANKETGYKEVNGARLYYETAGAGEPLVFVHGFTLDARMWDAQFDEFAKRYRVIRYDARGFGRSGGVTQSYSTADDLRELLTQLGVRQAHVVGLSMGGRYVIDFTLAYPEMVKSVVAGDPGLSGQPLPLIGKELLPAMAAAKAGNVAEGKRMWFAHSMFNPAREQPAVAASLKRMIDDYSGWHLVNGIGNMERVIQPPAAQRLGTIKVPALALIGARDLGDVHVIVDKIASEVPGARKAVIPGVGHFANMEAPAEFNRIVLEFLAGVK